MGFWQKKLIIIIGLACIILAYSLYGFTERNDDSRSLNSDTVPAPAENTPPAAQNGTGSEIVIYISGGVNKPGVYKLSQGSRVVDAVNLAGGFAPGADAARINLAMLIKDEMQINVPYMAAAAVTAAAPAGKAGTANTADQININTASQTELDKLPGIGPALAERIIEYRTANGPFRDITDLKKIPGIGESKYNQFKDKVTL
jgi:competence protein ComEA